MNKGWFVSVLLIFTVLIVCIGGVSAADNISDNQSASSDVGSGSVVTDSQVVDSEDSVVSQENSISDDNQILGDSDDGIVINSSADLESVLNDSTVNNTVVYLNNQSIAINQFNVNNRNLTFCGGKTLDDNLESTLEVIYSSGNRKNSNITFIRTNLVNSRFYNIQFSNFTFYDCELNNTTLRATYSNINVINSNISSINNSTHAFAEISNTKLNLINSTFTNIASPTVILSYYGVELNISNSTFENNSNSLGTLYTLSLNDDSNAYFTINNSIFNNSHGNAIHVVNRGDYSFNIDNCTFSNLDDSALILPQSSFNVNITNSLFENNSANCGAGIYFGKGNLSLKNCSFVNNSALYGAGVYVTTVTSHNGKSPRISVDNCSFIDNDAVAGAALSFTGNVSRINNSVFENNNAKLCGGAIILVNSLNASVLDCYFTNNTGNGYGNDIFYYGNMTLNYNGNPDVYNMLNNSTIASSLHIVTDYGDGGLYFRYDNLTGFCLERDMLWANGVFAHFNSTYVAINPDYNEYVGNYVKYAIYKYYGKIPILLLDKVIWGLTNEDFKNPNYINNLNNTSLNYNYNLVKRNNTETAPVNAPPYHPNILEYYDADEELAIYKEILTEIVNTVDNGFIIPDQGATFVNDDGTVSVYDFSSMLSPLGQNLILFGVENLTNASPDISIVKIANNPVVYKGNDTSFDIVVANNGSLMLSNVTVTEDSFDDLVYRSSSNITGNWTYSFVNGKHTWTLTGYLGVNQTARFNVVFTTVNSSVGNKTNTVSVITNENVTGNASNITEVIENSTPETPNNNTPNTPENNTPNKPTSVNNKTVENNNTQKADIKTDKATGYPFIPVILALIGIIGARTRMK